MSKPSPSGRLALALGRLLLHLGPRAYGPAERMLAWARQSTPRAEGWLAFAQGLRASQRNDQDTALERLRAASVALPDNPDVAVSLALALANADRWDVAIDSGERALKFFEEASSSAGLWQMLAWAYLITGRYPAVLELMQRMRDAGLGITLIHLPLMLARALLWNEEPPIAALRSLVRGSGSQLRACLRLVEHLAETRRDALAVSVLSVLPSATAIRALDTMATRAAGPAKAELVLWAANALRKLELVPELALAIASVASLVAGDEDASATYARQAAELGPDQGAVQERLALVWLMLGDETQARSAGSRAVMAGSSDALAAAVVAAGLMAKGELREARRVFMTQRVGDALGALVGHVIQAWIFVAGGDWDDMRRVLQYAADECGEVPTWARRPTLRAFLEVPLEAIAAAKPEEQNQQALERLRSWVSAFPW